MIERKRLAGLHAAEEKRFVADHPHSAKLFAEARGCLLGGVPMAWMSRWPGSFPLFFDQAAGARFTDVDGIEYVDFCLGDTGAMTGHALPQLAEALQRQAGRGITTMLPNADAIWVGTELVRRFGLPMWQMAMTATDANRFVLRFARCLTGRSKVLVFDRCYHGSLDETLVTLGPDGRAVSRLGHIGPQVDPELTTVVVPFNDITALAAALGKVDIACVLAEPALTNIGIVPPEPGFHEALRSLTRKHGVLLVIDETHTILRGPGRRHPGLGAGTRFPGDRQDHRWRHAGGCLWLHRCNRRPAQRAVRRPRLRHQRRGRYTHRQCARTGRGARDLG